MWSVHASKHTSIHTHAHNEVMLVWGSLRLAPINWYQDLQTPFPQLDSMELYTGDMIIICAVHMHAHTHTHPTHTHTHTTQHTLNTHTHTTFTHMHASHITHL